MQKKKKLIFIIGGFYASSLGEENKILIKMFNIDWKRQQKQFKHNMYVFMKPFHWQMELTFLKKLRVKKTAWLWRPPL